jgi:hypothetical protein
VKYGVNSLVRPAAAFALLAASCPLWLVVRLGAVDSDEIPFRKHKIDLGRSETVSVADINQKTLTTDI